jgi:phosphodiesterase/alkaline phosphatase D-like protein
MTDELVKVPAQWKIIGQQVMMAFGAPEYGINEDQWDGYPAEENGFTTVMNNEINNVVVLNGDIHTWANDFAK